MHPTLSSKKNSISCPKIFDLTQQTDMEAFLQLQTRGVHSIDTYKEQLQELFAIEHPSMGRDVFAQEFETHLTELESSIPLQNQGRWVYFPWLETIVHLLEHESFFLVRTARNRELISLEDQKKYYDGVIGIGGLSVGNSIALSIVLSGGCRRIKIADFDTLDLSNLNRIRAGVDVLGLPKVEVTARQIYLLNPYAEVELFPEGLTEDSIGSFFDDLNIMIDELDSLSIKYRVREEAKKRHIPVVMAADCAESGVIDVERYDHTPPPAFFHGRLGEISYEELLHLDKKAIGALIARHVGIENHNEQMLQSLQALGKTIVSWPQLGPTALLNSAAVAYCVRQILTNQPLIDNRAIMSLQEHLDPTHFEPARVASRHSAIESFKKFLGILNP